MEETRIHILGIPSYYTETKLKDHFSSMGTITDVKIIKTKEGTSREFGFIGFTSTKATKKAIKHFNKSYIDTSQIKVSLAKSYGSKDIERPWSRHSKKSSRYMEKAKGIRENMIKEIKTKRDLKNNNTDDVDGIFKHYGKKRKREDDDEFREFLTAANKKARLWQNDELGIKDDEVEEVVEGIKDTVEDDLDYLKSKMNSNFNYAESESSHDSGGSDSGSGSDDSSGSSSSDSGEESSDDSSVVVPKRKKNHTSIFKDKEMAIAKHGRLFLRNLPYTVSEEDIDALFGGFGKLTEVKVVRNKKTGEGKGTGFVAFENPATALKAYEKLDGSIFQGRLLHILPSKQKREVEHLPVSTKYSSAAYRSEYQKNLLKKLKEQSDDPGIWNPLYFRIDTVVESISDRYDVSKIDILSPEAQDLGVNQALMEASVIKETKEYLVENGVSLEALEGLNNTGLKRSDSVILAKNLPYTTEENDLREVFQKHGAIKGILLPPSKTMALVEFTRSSDASNAFSQLSYTEFKGVPLFLEWAPMGTWKSKNKLKKEDNKKEVKTSSKLNANDEIVLEEAENVLSEADTTLFVKNLNFETNETILENFFSSIGELRSVTIAKQKDMQNEGELRSLGYGFVEYHTRENAIEAFKKLQGADLDGYNIRIEFSKSKKKQARTERKTSTKRKKPSTKLMVRNIPFEANKKELRKLFAAYGEVKTVRLPWKRGQKQHRGFGFIDYLTKEEATSAIEALSSAHLYGRHLVIDYAEEEESIDQIRQKTKHLFNQ